MTTPRRRAPLRHRLTPAAVALVVLVGGAAGPAAAAPAAWAVAAASVSESPSPDATPDGPPPALLPTAAGVPADVAAWFASAGPGAAVTRGAGELDGVTPERRADVSIGSVRTVMTWSRGLIAGTDLTPAAEPTEPERWVAPVLLDGAAIGALFAVRDDDAVVLERVSGNSALGEALTALNLANPLIHDLALDAWFTVEGREVRAVDDAAEESLAGSVPLEVYQPFLAARSAEADPQRPGAAAPRTDAQDGSWTATTWVAVALAVVLAWTGVVVWVRRPEGDQRADAVGPRRGRHGRGPHDRPGEHARQAGQAGRSGPPGAGRTRRSRG